MKVRTVGAKLFLGMGTVIVSAVFLSMLILSQLILQFTRRELARNLEDGRGACGQFIALKFENLLGKARSVAETPYLKATLGIQAVDHETVYHIARQIHELTEMPLVLLTDSEGRLLADGSDSSRRDVALSAYPELGDALGGDGRVGVWKTGDVYHLAAVTPVTAGEAIIGALVLGIPVDDSFASEIRKATGRDALLLDESGLVADSRQGESDRRTSGEELVRLRSVIGASSSRPDASSFHTRLAGKDRLGIALPLGEGLTIVLTRATEEIMKLYGSTVYWLGAVGLLTSVLALAVSQRISRRLSRPIQRLTEASEAMARGDLSARVEEIGSDEIGVLATSFNTMTRQIESLFQDVERKAHEAEAASRAKSEFLANMSHELRTPLNGVIGMTELTLQSDLEPEQKENLQIVTESAESLLVLLNDVLEFSKFDTGKLCLETVAFGLRETLEEPLKALEFQAREKELDLHCRVEPEVPDSLVGDPARLRQIIVTLLGNAIKFTSRGEICLAVALESAEPASICLHFSVRDEGIGIPEEMHQVIFDAFSQVDGSCTREYGGTGLGLGISSRLAGMMGGKMWVDSEVGKGSKFHFTARFDLQSRPVCSA